MSGDQRTDRFAIGARNTVWTCLSIGSTGLFIGSLFWSESSESGDLLDCPSSTSYHFLCSIARPKSIIGRGSCWTLISYHNSLHFSALNDLLVGHTKMGGEESSRLSLRDDT